MNKKTIKKNLKPYILFDENREPVMVILALSQTMAIIKAANALTEPISNLINHCWVEETSLIGGAK